MKLNGERHSNSHIENYWRVLKKRLNECKNVGNTPAKCLRVLREINIRTTSLCSRIANGIPKSSLKNNQQRLKEPNDGITLNEAFNVNEGWQKRNLLKRIESRFSLKRIHKIDDDNIIELMVKKRATT